MTHEEKIQYMKLATAICGYGFEEKTVDLFVTLYDQIVADEGGTDLKTILAIQASVMSEKKGQAWVANTE